MSCDETKRFDKNCGLLISERVGDNKQKISPNLAKRTDFLVHKAQILKPGVDFNRKGHQFHERVHFWGVGFILKGKGSKLRAWVQLDFEP